jgi:hypothetical protein
MMRIVKPSDREQHGERSDIKPEGRIAVPHPNRFGTHRWRRRRCAVDGVRRLRERRSGLPQGRNGTGIHAE